MKYNVSFSQIVDRLVVVLNNSELTAEYQEDAESYEGVCGWCGVMAPLTRLAFIKEFGKSTVELAELEARSIIQKKAEEYLATNFCAHSLAAYEHANNGCPVPAEGDFVWGVTSGLKGEGGYRHELRWLVEFSKEDGNKEPRLMKVEKVIQVDALPMTYQECDPLVKEHGLEGGFYSDDLTEEQLRSHNLTQEQTALIYSIAAVVVDKAGRWYMIDAEGYDYCRYFYSALNYSQVFEPEISAIQNQLAEEKAEKERQEREAAEKRLAEYQAKCQKWAPYMEEVESYEKAVSAAWSKFVDAGMKRGSAEAKAHTSAERKLNNCRRRNILAMAQAAFPGVKFTLTKEHGWGADWQLCWTDGPTDEEFDAQTDLELFATYGDRFNGMEDLSYTQDYEFTDFAQKYMGSRTKEVEARRHMSEETKQAIYAKIAEVVAYEGENDGDYVNFDNSVANTLAKHLGVDYGKLYAGEYNFDKDRFYVSRYTLAYRVFINTSYFVAPETPATPDPTNSPKGGKKAVSVAENGENGDAPAGLHLVEIEGGVAVVGDDWKDTYFHKREIKAHGATWNKAQKQWQATDPEAVSELRKWFGLSADEQTATAETEAETEAETAAVIESANNQRTDDDTERQEQLLRHNCALNHDAFYKLKDRFGLKSSIIFFRYADHCELYGHDAQIGAKWLNRKPVAPRDPAEGSVLFYGLWIDNDYIYQAEDIFCKKGIEVVWTDGRLMEAERTEVA